MAVLSDAQREAGWTVVKLGDIVTCLDHLRQPIKGLDRVPGPYPYYGASGVVDYIDQYAIDGKYLLISEDGENLRSRSLPIAFYAVGKSWVNNHAHIISASDSVMAYVKYVLNSHDVSAYLTGTTMPKLSQKSMMLIDIPLPPQDILERIAGILGSLDDKIEANTRLIQTLDSLGEAVTRKYLKSVQETQKLIDIAHIVMGQSPKGETLNTEGSGVLFFQGKKDFGFRYPTPRTYTTAATRMAEPLDILFSVRAPIGALNRSVEACCVGRGLAAIRSSCGQENTLFYTLKTNPNLWEKFEGEGTIFSAINKKGLSELDIPFSETATSNGVEDFLTSVEQEIFSLEKENLQLAETRDALIKRLIG